MSKASGAQVRAAQLLAQTHGGLEVEALPLRLANLPSEQQEEARALIGELLPHIIHRGQGAAPRSSEDSDVQGR